MFGWPKFPRRRIECESWAEALATPRAQISGQYPTREEELEFLLSEAKKEVQTKQEWIDMCHDVHIKQAEALRKKEMEVRRLQQENAALRQVKAIGLHTEKLLHTLSCPISLMLFKKPVVSKTTGNTFEEEEIFKLLLTSDKCPLTRMKISKNDFVRNYNLQSVCEVVRASGVEPSHF